MHNVVVVNVTLYARVYFILAVKVRGRRNVRVIIVLGDRNWVVLNIMRYKDGNLVLIDLAVIKVIDNSFGVINDDFVDKDFVTH